MPKYLVTCEPNTLTDEYEAPDRDAALETALDDWCPCLGAATDAITAGSFDVRLVSE